MYDEMTIDDAINVANILSDVLASDPNGEVQKLAIAARRLARHIGEQACELERERARQQALGTRVRAVHGWPSARRRSRRGWPPRLSGGPARARRRDALLADIHRLARRAV